MFFLSLLFSGLLTLEEELYSQWLINRIEQVNILEPLNGSFTIKVRKVLIASNELSSNEKR